MGSADRDREPSLSTRPPRPDEYLPSAIHRAVVDTGVKHPLTVYPVALGISSGAVGWLFDLPILYAIALALIILGPIWAVSTIFFRHDTLGGKYLQSLNIRQQQYETTLKRQLEVGLEECRKIKGMETYADQGAEQLNSIRMKFSNVKELLDMKLHSGEITFGRFLGAAEQVSLSVLDNLKRMVSILKSAASIQPDTIKKRQKALSEKKGKSREDMEQENALKQRLALWDEQLGKVDRLISSNEKAMTEMEQVSAAVAEWRTDGRFASIDFESAIAQLHELATRAYEYDNNHR